MTASLVAVPGASTSVRGGVVAYATDVKHSLLGVDAVLLEAHGAVHPEVARQMADGVRRALCRTGDDVHVGIATTAKDKDGRQHMVIVDLNERDTVIRAKNIETVLPDSRWNNSAPASPTISSVSAPTIRAEFSRNPCPRPLPIGPRPSVSRWRVKSISVGR